MAFLGRAKKEDLKVLAEELGEVVQPQFRVIDLKNLIEKSEGYEVDFVKAMLEGITKRREEQEEIELKKEERHFELEKLKIEASARSGPQNPENREIRKPSWDLNKLIQRFDPKEGDISLYLIIFERQARRIDLQKADWVSHLISLLPTDTVELIAREDEELSNDYEHVKKILLKRYKLSPETFRTKFVQHQRKPENSWKDFIFDLRNFLEEWLEGLEIKDLESLKDLMVCDQVKRRVSSEVREHFIDEWATISASSKLAEMLDSYESVRKVSKKPFNAGGQERKKIFMGPNNKERRSPLEENGHQNNFRSDNRHDERFEKRRPPRCYECDSPFHLRPQCPEVKRKEVSETVNHIVSVPQKKELLAPYISDAKINGKPMSVLRDSGATIDIICRKHIASHMFTGEHVFVQQPLDSGQIRLPVAQIEIERGGEVVKTKAAIVADELDRGYYLLGNRTASMFTSYPSVKSCPPLAVSAVRIRSQKESLSEEIVNKEPAKKEEIEMKEPVREKYIEIEEPNKEKDIEIEDPVKEDASREPFAEAQQADIGLTDICKSATKRSKTVNLLLCAGKENDTNDDIDFLYIENDPNVYKFDEIKVNIDACGPLPVTTTETLMYEHWTDPQSEQFLVKMEELQTKRKLCYDEKAVKREFKGGGMEPRTTKVQPYEFEIIQKPSTTNKNVNGLSRAVSEN